MSGYMDRYRTYVAEEISRDLDSFEDSIPVGIIKANRLLSTIDQPPKTQELFRIRLEEYKIRTEEYYREKLDATLQDIRSLERRKRAGGLKSLFPFGRIGLHMRLNRAQANLEHLRHCILPAHLIGQSELQYQPGTFRKAVLCSMRWAQDSVPKTGGGKPQEEDVAVFVREDGLRIYVLAEFISGQYPHFHDVLFQGVNPALKAHICNIVSGMLVSGMTTSDTKKSRTLHAPLGASVPITSSKTYSMK